MEGGVAKSDRTGTGTRSVFGHQMRYPTSPGLPADHHQEGAPQVDRLRAAVVPARRLQRRAGCRSTASPSGTNGPGADGELGPVYGVQWRSWPTPDGGHVDQISEVLDTAPARPRLAAHHRLGLERRRHPADGAAAVPRVLPVLRRRRPALLPALPAQRRPVPRRAVQHRQLRAAHPHDGRSRPASDVGEFVWTGGDCHIYDNHVEQVTRAARRASRTRSRRSDRRRRRRSSTTASRTSRCSTTSTTRRSGRRSRSEAGSMIGLDLGAVARAG